jgi:malate/lactate dehydrogenase
VDRVRGLSAVGYSWKLAKIELGVAADIGHINTKSVVTGYQPDADGLKKALTGAEIVLIPAGVPRKPGMTRDGIVYSREVSIG